MVEVINLRETKIMRGMEQNRPEADALPGLELHQIVEGMSRAERAEYKERLLSEMDDREKLIWLINEVDEVEKA